MDTTKLAPQAPVSPAAPNPAGGAPDSSALSPGALPGPPAPTGPSPQEQEWAKRFAAATKKEKDLFFKEQELKREREKYTKYSELEKLKAENPFKFAQEVGLDLNALIQGAAKDGEPPSVEDKLAALEKRLADKEAQEAEAKQKAQEAQNQQNIDNFRKQIQDFVKADLDKYELINLDEEGSDLVYSVIDRHFNDTFAQTGQGEIMSMEDAAGKVEDWLLARATKYRQAKKLGFTVGEKNETAKAETLADALVNPPAKQEPVPDTERGFTLSASTTARTETPAPRFETRDELLARVTREFNAKIKARQG